MLPLTGSFVPPQEIRQQTRDVELYGTEEIEVFWAISCSKQRRHEGMSSQTCSKKLKS